MQSTLRSVVVRIVLAMPLAFKQIPGLFRLRCLASSNGSDLYAWTIQNATKANALLAGSSPNKAAPILSPSPTYYEITGEERRSSSYYFRLWELSGRSVSTDLACFRGIADLLSEYSRETGQTAREAKAMEAVKRDRQCGGWYPYETGFNPMEHFLWYQEQEREKDRRAFEERLSERAEELHKSLALRDEQSQTQRDQAATSTNKLMTRLTVLALALAIAQVLTLTHESLIAKIATWMWRYLRSLF